MANIFTNVAKFFIILSLLFAGWVTIDFGNKFGYTNTSYAGYGLMAFGFLLTLFWVSRWWRNRPRPNDEFVLDPENPPQRRGIWLDPIQTRIIFVILTISVPLLIVVPFQIILEYINPNFFWKWWVASIIISLPIFGFNLWAWSNVERRSVPAAHVSLFTFFGKPWEKFGGIYLTAADEASTPHLIPASPFLGTYRTLIDGPLPNTREGDASNPGLIAVGNIQFSLIDRDLEPDDPKVLSCVAFDRAIVRMKPTIEIRAFHPVKRLGENDLKIVVEEQARTLFRRILGMVTSIQANEFQGEIAKWFSGWVGYLIRTRSKRAQFSFIAGDVIKRAGTSENIVRDSNPVHNTPGRTFNVAVVAEIIRYVEEKGQPRMVAFARAKRGGGDRDDPGKMAPGETEGQLSVTTFMHAEDFHRRLFEAGYCLAKKPAIGDIDAPDEYLKASAAATAEIPQRQKALADARTEAEAAEIRRRDGGLDARTAALVTAAEENPDGVKVVHISGDSDRPVIISPT